MFSTALLAPGDIGLLTYKSRRPCEEAPLTPRCERHLSPNAVIRRPCVDEVDNRQSFSGDFAGENEVSFQMLKPACHGRLRFNVPQAKTEKHRLRKRIDCSTVNQVATPAHFYVVRSVAMKKTKQNRTKQNKKNNKGVFFSSFLARKVTTSTLPP